MYWKCYSSLENGVKKQIQQAKQRKAEIVRCPYCVSGTEFRSMVRKPEGLFICTRCRHTAMPAGLFYKCGCQKCAEHDWGRNLDNAA
jgi:hypothetical protein